MGRKFPSEVAERRREKRVEKRRVIDEVTGDLGTVVAHHSDGAHRRYLIAWDDPTPHQGRAWAAVPSAFFDWYDEP